MINELLQQEIQALSGDRHVGVLYFNDLDSFSLGCAADLSGRQVTLHVFTLNSASSKYVEGSCAIAQKMRWQIEIHDIDTSTFFEQIRSLFASINLHRKSDVAMFYVASALLQKISGHLTLCPFGLDILCGLSSSFGGLHKNNAQEFLTLRRTLLERSHIAENCIALQTGAKQTLFAPYAQSQVLIDHFLGQDWRTLNMDSDCSRVQLKSAVRRAFQKQICSAGTIDTHSNAFKSSGLNSLIDEVIKNKSVNFRKRRKLGEILIDWRLKRAHP